MENDNKLSYTEIDVGYLIDDNEMLSHIFFGCIPIEELLKIKEKFIGKEGEEKDWRKESVKVPVEMKIGGVSVNPKKFFDSWRDQMERMISEKAQELVAEKLLSEKPLSEKMREMQNKLYEYEKVLESWEKDIDWYVTKPFRLK